MNNLNTAKSLTKAGVISLAVLACIGVIAALLAFGNVNLHHLQGTFLEGLFVFVFASLWIVVAFCFPAAFLISFTSIASSLKAGLTKKDGEWDE